MTMNRSDPASAPHSGDSEEDLFEKLDQLISRHQRRPVHPLAETPVPLLTEAVDASHDPEIPVLEEAVDLPRAPTAVDSPLADKRRQLQVALYLRLRQRLDEALDAGQSSNAASAAHAVSGEPPHGEIAGPGHNAAAARLAQELRNALPAIVRESVEQVLGAEPGAEE
jgi:hypothetical protein